MRNLTQGENNNITILYNNYCFGLTDIMNYYSNPDFIFILCFDVVVTIEERKKKSTDK